MVDKQSRFAETVALFILKATQLDYQLSFGEAWRPSITAEYYAKQGKGIEKSLHTKRLAIDLNAFYDDKYLDGSQSWHLPHLEKLGKLWKSLDPESRWGGDFKAKDYNHYSFEHNGVR